MKLTLRLLLVTALFTSALVASAIPGRAVVTGVTGTASVTSASGVTKPLLKDAVLGQGDTISTGAGSTAVLWLGLNGDGLILDVDTTVKLEVLDIVHIGNRTVNTRLLVIKGRILGDVVTKMTAASKYEMTNGKAGGQVTGTQYAFKADGTIIVIEGTVRFGYIPAGQTTMVYVTVTRDQSYTPGAAAAVTASEADLNGANRLLASGMATFYSLINHRGEVVRSATQTANPLDTSVSALD